MKITELTYSFSAKINLGGYESCDIFCCAKSVVDPDQAPDDVFDELR